MATPAPAVKKSLWTDPRPTCSILNLGVIVLTVVGRKDDEWIVTSSHGDPRGEHPSRETAKKYAEKFAANMIEKTLAGLSELESHLDAPANGWGPKMCVLLVLHIPPHDDNLEEDGTAHPDVFEANRSKLIDDTRASLRKILTDLNR